MTSAISGQKALAPLFLLLVLSIFMLALSAPGAHAQNTVAPSSTQYDSVIEYQTTSGYTPQNVNVTWTNTDDCGVFGGQGAGASWDWGTGVGATPCTSTLPTGTIIENITAGGVFLASCTDPQGAETYGSITVSNTLPECTDSGMGVSINSFNAQAFDASGNPISAGSGGNDDWIIAAVVIIIVLVLLFFLWRRRKKTPPVAGQAPPTAQTVPPTTSPQGVAKSYCANCGSALDPGASFCRSCGAKAS
ncbi:MAG: zinc ribbon domain-containing protein [Nitrososphaerales archaeon]